MWAGVRSVNMFEQPHKPQQNLMDLVAVEPAPPVAAASSTNWAAFGEPTTSSAGPGRFEKNRGYCSFAEHILF